MNATDDTGNKILEVIAGAKRFNRWMYQTIRPFAHGNILEVGSGLGNISAFFLADNIPITLSDTEPYYIEQLSSKYGSSPALKDVLKLDLEQPDFENVHSTLRESFDTVFLLNVLEHIGNDKVAISNCKFLLKPGAVLIVLTPAYSFLFSRLDKALGHHRRYTRLKLRTLFSENKIVTEKSFYFNSLGIMAWLYGKIFRLKTIPNGEMSFYNRLVPLARGIDKITGRKTGLSVISIGKKQASAS